MPPFKLTISCSPSEAGVEGTVLDVPPLRIGDGTSLTYQPFSNLVKYNNTSEKNSFSIIVSF